MAASLAALNGLVLFAIAISYMVRPDSLRGLIQVEIIAGLSLIGVLYYASIHHFLRRFHQGLSSLIIAIITALNLILVIDETGGLDSPVYALWLIAIVGSGMFGQVYTIAILALTLLAHFIALAQHGFSASYFSSHIIQLLISFIAAALAEWVYYRGTVSRRQAVDSLSGRLTEEQLKANALMTSMADGVVVVDQSRHILLMNKAAEKLTGWEEISAKNIDYRLVLKLQSGNKDITDENDPFIKSWAEQSSLVKNDLICTSKDGKRIELSASIAPIYNNEKQITGGIAVLRDISREKEVERTRNEFVSTASHEMRTPVAAIEGYISLAMNAKVATVDDRAMSYLSKAHENTQHLGALFRDLLSVTKLDEGLIARNLTPVDITKMLQDITTDMQFAAAKKNLTITFMSTNMGSRKVLVPSYWVMVDAERMREVIMNLIENGMKFTSEGGITVNVTGDDKAVTVSLHDTGIGIPKEDIGHLFQKFYRVDNSATRTIGGTGLGLYLCRTLIELFNGLIWVESEFGKGSTFFFKLPRIETPAGAPATESLETAPIIPASVAQTEVAPAPVPISAPQPQVVTTSTASPSLAQTTEPAPTQAPRPIVADITPAPNNTQPIQIKPTVIPVAS